MNWFRFALTAVVLLALVVAGDGYGLLGSRIPGPARLLSPFSGFWQLAEPARPGYVEYRMTDWPCEGEVIVDERGVPHIFAPSQSDAVFLLGYWHAKDRLWQMDISTRATGGRLAEVLGSDLLERDRLQRRKGLTRAARRSLEAWKTVPEEWALIEHYCAGVNAYISELSPRDFPLEYQLLGYAPELWTPLHTAIFFKGMAEDLSFRHHDLQATQTRAFLGDSLFQDLFPEHNPRQSPVIPDDTKWAFDPLPIAPQTRPGETRLTDGAIPFLPLPQSPEGVGSNNWALAGTRTASGYPLLANDPHLALTLPAIWYEVQLHTPDVNAYGVSLPGVPAIIIGFNEQAAWGLTNVGHDVLDWYRIQWTDGSREAYLLDGEARPTEWVNDTIWIRDRPEPVIERIPWTEWGPVTYTDSTRSYQDLAMRWVAHDRPTDKSFHETGTFWQLMAAANYDDYRTALAGFENPAQNFVFAAHDGDIALTVNGKLPLKADQQGRFIQDGSRRDNGWAGFIPQTQVPATRNPERGFVASANQRSTAPSYPYYYNGSFDDYRGRYINRRLADMTAATPDSMMALQQSAYSILAEDGLPPLLEAMAGADTSEVERAMLSALQSWDGEYRAEAVAPCLYEEWRDRFYKLTFDELTRAEDSLTAVYWPEWWRLLDLLARAPEHEIFDLQTTGEREQAGDIARAAFHAMAAELDRPFTAGNLAWARRRDTHIPHLGRIPGMGTSLIWADGFRQAPNALTDSHGPSWRMVVSLEAPVQAWGVYPGGASGNPGSPWYDHGLENWRQGAYFPLFLLRSTEDPRVAPTQRWTFR